jgi:hypothetical protein
MRFRAARGGVFGFDVVAARYCHSTRCFATCFIGNRCLSHGLCEELRLNTHAPIKSVTTQQMSGADPTAIG